MKSNEYKDLEVFKRAVKVLGDEKAAERWFSTKKLALGNKMPINLCQTYAGTVQINDLLGRMENGVFS